MATVQLLVCVLAIIVSSEAYSADFTPVTHPIDSLDSSQCRNGDNPVTEQLQATMKTVTDRLLTPPMNCKDIFRMNQSSPTGMYSIINKNGAAMDVYCVAEGDNCGGEGGWTRVGILDFTDPATSCPTDFTLDTTDGKRFCRRDTMPSSCKSIPFVVAFGPSYSKVCGRVLGYAYTTVDGFALRPDNVALDDNYVDGVSITHGSPPRSHVWTFVAGNNEYSNSRFSCPCNTESVWGAQTYFVPSYVGLNYTCESASSSPGSWKTADVLWDGQQCNGREGPCCANPSLPWFKTDLPAPTTDDLEVRVCVDEYTHNEDVGVELIELYVK